MRARVMAVEMIPYTDQQKSLDLVDGYTYLNGRSLLDENCNLASGYEQTRWPECLVVHLCS